MSKWLVYSGYFELKVIGNDKLKNSKIAMLDAVGQEMYEKIRSILIAKFTAAYFPKAQLWELHISVHT